MRGRLVDLTIGLNRKQRITVEVDRDYREDYERLKDAELDIEIKSTGKNAPSPPTPISMCW